MISSPDDTETGQPLTWFLAICALVLAQLVVGTGPLMAQSSGTEEGGGQGLGAPILLMPVQPLQPDTGATSSGNINLGTEQGLDQVPQVEGIEINPLSERDPQAIGILSAAEGGLGTDLWLGSQPEVIANLLSVMPGDISSPLLRDLAVRLLLTSTAPPKAANPQVAAAQSELIALLSSGGAASDDILALRVEKLAQLGEVAPLGTLLAAVPERYDDARIAQARIDVDLTRGDFDGACRRVRRTIDLYAGVPYWPQAMIFCQLLAGEQSQAELGLDLLRELGSDDSPAFLALAEQMAGGAARDLAPFTLTPLLYAMLRSLERDLPPENAPLAAPMVLPSLASWPVANMETRTLAAERAVARGLMAPADLVALYKEFRFSSQELSSALSLSAQLPAVEARALLYQAAAGQGIAVTQAEFLQAALEASGDDETYRVMVQALEPQLTALPARRDLLWFAATAGKAQFALGKHQQALAWFRLAQREALRAPEAEKIAAELWPYVRLAGGGALAGSQGLADWAETQAPAGDPEQIAAQLGLLLAAFQTLGESDPLTWGALASPNAAGESLSDSALLFLLQQAGNSGQRGESLLAILGLIGEAGPSADQVVAFAQSMTAFSQIGLAREARELAIEAALASGI